VEITGPKDGEIITGPTDITITADVTDSNNVNNVEFYANSQKLGNGAEDQSPYTFVWKGVKPGVYNLVAKATDDYGTAMSKSILIVVVPVNPLGKSDLALTMTLSPEPVPAGGWLNYLLTVTNRGPNSATDVTVENFLPSQLTYVTSKPSQGTYDEGIWNVGGLEKYHSAKLVLNVQAPEKVSVGLIPNTAYVFGNEYDPDNSNNHATAYIKLKSENASLT
jgi:uncharacterized repeat protein (TIGR01451 family)